MKYLVAAALAGLIVSPALAAPKHVTETRIVKKVVHANGDTVDATDTEAAQIVANCNARKFETTAELEKNGQRRITKLKLCSAEGEDEMSWVKSLEDAKVKIGANADISEQSRAKIVAELDAEIARLHSAMDH